MRTDEETVISDGEDSIVFDWEMDKEGNHNHDGASDVDNAASHPKNTNGVDGQDVDESTPSVLNGTIVAKTALNELTDVESHLEESSETFSSSSLSLHEPQVEE